MAAIRGIDQVFLDIDGVLMLGELPIPGGTATVTKLLNLGVKVAYVSNTTTRPRRKVHEELVKLGFHVELDDVLTPAIIAREKILRLKNGSTALFVHDDVMEDFEGLRITNHRAGAVLMGDMGESFSPEMMDQIFRLTFSGSELLAMTKNRFRRDDRGLHLDLGPYVAAVEYATGKRADIVGKPAPSFFRGLISHYGIRPEAALMVGDEVGVDVKGAQRVGMKTVLVKTGKFDFDYVKRSGVLPDNVVPSIADLLPALGIEA